MFFNFITGDRVDYASDLLELWIFLGLVDL